MKSKYFIQNFVFIIILIFSLFSCSPKDNAEISPLILEKLQEKNRLYTEDILARCKKAAVEKAEKYVDSIFSEQIQISLNDTIFFPVKPIKPPSEGEIKIIDTVRVKPIF